MQSDLFSKVDVGTPALGDWVAVNFAGDSFDTQALVNNAGFTVEVSFDAGTTVHGELAATGVTSAVSWEKHRRAGLWVRRAAGAAGAAAYVHAYASGAA